MLKPYYHAKHLDKVSWFWLSANPSAIRIIEQNMDKVDWRMLSGNPNAMYLIVIFDYARMKANCMGFAEKLAAHVFHPKRMVRFAEAYDVDVMDLITEVY